jgi:hypothetical protein
MKHIRDRDPCIQSAAAFKSIVDAGFTPHMGECLSDGTFKVYVNLGLPSFPMGAEIRNGPADGIWEIRLNGTSESMLKNGFVGLVRAILDERERLELPK